MSTTNSTSTTNPTSTTNTTPKYLEIPQSWNGDKLEILSIPIRKFNEEVKGWLDARYNGCRNRRCSQAVPHAKEFQKLCKDNGWGLDVHANELVEEMASNLDIMKQPSGFVAPFNRDVEWREG